MARYLKMIPITSAASVVVDASLLVDAIIEAGRFARRIIDVELHAPVTIDAEVLQALRRRWLVGQLDDEEARTVLPACGISVGEYVVHLLDIPVPKRTPPEVLERIRSRTAVDVGISAADLIRAGREERMQQLDEPWWSSTPQR